MKIKLYTEKEMEKAKQEAYCSGYAEGVSRGMLTECLNAQRDRDGLNPSYPAYPWNGPTVTCKASDEAIRILRQSGMKDMGFGPVGGGC